VSFIFCEVYSETRPLIYKNTLKREREKKGKRWQERKKKKGGRRKIKLRSSHQASTYIASHGLSLKLGIPTDVRRGGGEGKRKETCKKGKKGKRKEKRKEVANNPYGLYSSSNLILKWPSRRGEEGGGGRPLRKKKGKRGPHLLIFSWALP